MNLTGWRGCAKPMVASLVKSVLKRVVPISFLWAIILNGFAGDLVITDWLIDVDGYGFPEINTDLYVWRTLTNFGTARTEWFDTVFTHRALAAYQSPGGWDSVEVDISNPGGYSRTLHGVAGLHFTVKNEGALPVPMHFGLLINRAALELHLVNFVSSDDWPTAEIGVAITTNANTFLWRYQATVTHASSETLPGLQDSLGYVDPQSVGKPRPHITRTNGWIQVQFDPFGALLNMGNLDPQKTLRFDYQMSAWVQCGVHNTNVIQFPNPPEMNAHALIADPFELTSGFTINGQSLISLLPGAPRITVARTSPAQVELSWPTNFLGWTLHAQTNLPGQGLGTNWSPIIGSTTTNRVVVPAGPTGSVFYRLSQD